MTFKESDWATRLPNRDLHTFLCLHCVLCLPSCAIGRSVSAPIQGQSLPCASDSLLFISSRTLHPSPTFTSLYWIVLATYKCASVSLILRGKENKWNLSWSHSSISSFCFHSQQNFSRENRALTVFPSSASPNIWTHSYQAFIPTILLSLCVKVTKTSVLPNSGVTSLFCWPWSKT